MAINAYVNQKCRDCGQPVQQTDTTGRVKEFCNAAHKMRFHRREKSRCLHCGHAHVLPPNYWIGHTTKCWHCHAEMKSQKNPKTNKPTWVLTKKGQKKLPGIERDDLSRRAKA